MNKEQILGILPHRDDMLLLDEAESLGEGKAKGSYTVKGTEFFLNGHFPGNPVVPGVILCEIIGQTCCALFADSMAGKTPYYAGMDKVKFRRMVKPGDKIDVEVELVRSKMNVHVVSGIATVDGDLSVRGEFTFIIA